MTSDNTSFTHTALPNDSHHIRLLKFVRLEEGHHRYPFRVIHEKLTMRQIMLILTQAGRHNTYWDKPL